MCVCVCVCVRVRVCVRVCVCVCVCVTLCPINSISPGHCILLLLMNRSAYTTIQAVILKYKSDTSCHTAV